MIQLRYLPTRAVLSSYLSRDDYKLCIDPYNVEIRDAQIIDLVYEYRRDCLASLPTG